MADSGTTDGQGGDSGGSFDPESPANRDVGRGALDQFGTVGAHLYRGEIHRMTTWRQRLDQTTRWAVTLMAAILTWAFSSQTNPHYILLIGVVVVTCFLWIEARRYRGYDVWRARVRMLQQNLFAEALDPSQGVDRDDWRSLLSSDFHDPEPKMSQVQALSHRLRRVYVALLGVLVIAWIVRITMFDPENSAWQTAAIGSIPGTVVIAAVGAFCLGVLVLALWPWGHAGRHVRGEIYGSETNEWSDRDEK